VRGTVTLANPDRTQHELPMLNPKVNDKTFEFHTNDQGAIFHLRLTINEKNARRGLLKGRDRRPGKLGSSNGEMLIQVPVQKTG
jgi:hypothetical protein